MAGTTLSDDGIASLISQYYDTVLLERLVSKKRYDQFAIKKNLPEHNGITVHWNRLSNLGSGYRLTELTVPGLSAMSSNRVSASVFRDGQLLGISEPFNMHAISQPIKDAMELLADSAKLTVDNEYKEAIGFGSATSTGIAGAASATYQSCRTMGFPILENSNVRWTAFAMVNNMFSTNITVARVGDAVTHLRNMDCLPFDDGYYVGIIYPSVADRLSRDTTWASWNQYTNAELMYKGEIGKVQGVRFVDSTNAIAKTVLASTWSAGSSNFSAGGTLYGTLIFGKGAYGGTNMYPGDGVKTAVTDMKPDKADPLGQYGTAGYTIAMACKILNPSCGIIVGDYISA